MTTHDDPTLPPPPDGIAVRAYEPLARHTYLRLGGAARYFAEPQGFGELERLMDWTRVARLPLRVIGGGSNLLIADEGVQALVISLRRVSGGFGFEGTQVVAGSAVMLPALARAAAERSLGGLEFAIGIPGTVGGALMSNAGIGDGRDIGSLVQSVEVMGGRGRQTLLPAQLQFGYRQSALRHAGVMVIAATLQLTPRPRAEIEAEMRRLLEQRQASQPTADPNAGSIFRNPPGDHAGRLIDAAGCKGLRVGGAHVSELHANFIVHDGTATAADVVALMEQVQERVFSHAGVWLTPEIVWWGDGPVPAPWAERG